MRQSNIYEAGAADIATLFGDYLEEPGDGDCVALVLSERALASDARNAVEKSLESFGYGPCACTFATLAPAGPDTEGGDIALDANALFLLMEGVDPVLVICADEASADVLGQAYRTSFAPDSPARVFGRSAVVFRDLQALIATETGKQKAWRLLKTLPKRSR